MKSVVSTIVLLLMLSLTACNNHVDEGPESVGRLFVSVEIDPSLSLPDGTPAPLKAAHDITDDDISLTLSSASGQYAHTWPSLRLFEQGEDYFAGAYTLSADAGRDAEQGFDTPRFTGETQVEVKGFTDVTASVILTPASAFFRVNYTEAFLSTFPGAVIQLQSDASAAFRFEAYEQRLLSLDPAPAGVSIWFPSGMAFGLTRLPSLKAATLYSVTADASTDPDGVRVVTVSIPGIAYTSVRLTPEFLASTPPTTRFGTNSRLEVELPEGEDSDSPVAAGVIPGSSPLSRLLLTVNSASLAAKGVPVVTDLLDATSEGTKVLHSLGLKTNLTAQEGGEVDFSSLLGALSYLSADNAVSTFTLCAEDLNGRLSEPAVLRVKTLPVELSIASVSAAVMGIDKADITVITTATDFHSHVELLTAGADSIWHTLPIVSVSSSVAGVQNIVADVGEGSTDVAVRLSYCDEVRASFTIKREMPDFSLVVDPYAAFANILVVPADPELLKVIIPRLRFYLNNAPYTLFRTDADNGLLTIIGLEAGTSYSVKATMMNPEEITPTFCRAVSFTTESTPQLPNPDFEERRDGPSYSSLPSGGLYSQTTVEIFNRQHHTDFNLRVPKSWTTVNDKTFNRAFVNHNTWYMYPSTYSLTSPTQNGTFAVELLTTAFDPAGATIPPYAQTGTPYLDYSPVVPDIAYRAAGRLFLGSYSFDPATVTETYSEGIAWTSRPLSLNGYYIFTPCDADRTDTGLVRIEVLGAIDDTGETVIASGELQLPLCTGWKAFSVPLTYRQFGVKARRLKVMFASSRHAGTIAEETASIITLDDPVSATSTGGRLSLDNIYLSY